MKASPNYSTSKAKKYRKPVRLASAECYGPSIRFGTRTNLSPDDFSTDSENIDFLLPIEVTFGNRNDILAFFSVRNLKKSLNWLVCIGTQCKLLKIKCFEIFFYI